MVTAMEILSRLLRDESGATAIEYGLIVALIVIVVIGGINGVGFSAHLNATFSSVSRA